MEAALAFSFLEKKIPNSKQQQLPLEDSDMIHPDRRAMRLSTRIACTTKP